MQLVSTLSPHKIAMILGILTLYFAAQSLIVEYLIENVLNEDTHSDIIHVVDLFSVNIEESIPTWYASLLLFGAAVLLAFIATAKASIKEKFAVQWAGLAVIFVYLSIDEGAAVHEVAADVLQRNLPLTGYLYFGWQLVYAPLVMLFAVVYWRFLFHLPPRTRNLFVLAALMYVGGAVIVEGISANQWYLDGGQSFEYLAIATIEEFSEMLGVVVLTYALLAYMTEMRYAFVFQTFHTIQEPDNRTSELLKQNAVETIVTSPFRASWRSVILAAIIVLAGNIALISWINLRVSQDITTTNQSIMNQLAEYDIRVIPLQGRFGIDNLIARQAAASLLTEYEEVMIVTWASAETSIALAADELPFDRNGLIDMLHANGEAEFVIFETLAVQAIVGDTSAG